MYPSGQSGNGLTAPSTHGQRVWKGFNGELGSNGEIGVVMGSNGKIGVVMEK